MERAAKYAISVKHKLRLLVERCNKTDDQKIMDYYATLRTSGPPFDANTSKQYGPLTVDQYKNVLHELRLKRKSSPLIQIADLYLWPMCIGGYHRSNRPFVMLKEAGRLMDVVYDRGRLNELGIKYSCFDLVKPQP